MDINIPFIDYKDIPQQRSKFVEYTRYDVKSLPLDFVQSIDCQSRINEAILRLESGNKLQNDINGMYSDFVASVKMEMNEKINFKTCSIAR